MTDRDVPAGQGRLRPDAGPAAGAWHIAGARRQALISDDAPLWLRAASGWSWRIIVVIAAVSLVFWATTKVLLLFISVFLAMVFTSVLRPVVKTLSRWLPRWLATTLSLILAIAVVAGLFTYVGFSVAGQWNYLGQQFQDGLTTILEYVKSSPLHLTITTADVQNWWGQAQIWIQQHSSAIATTALSSAGSVAEVFTALALATFLTVFLLNRGTEMWTWFLNQIPERMRTSWFIGGGVAWYTFSGYTRGTFLVAASDALLAAIALLAFRVPLAAPLSVLVFIGAFIPLIGAPLAMVIAMIVALAANGLVTALAVGLVIAGIGQIEGHFLQPMIMSKQVSLHPVAVALSVVSGTLVAGILGAVIAVPLVAVAWAVFSKLRHVDPPTTLAELAAVAGPMHGDEQDEATEPTDEGPGERD